MCVKTANAETAAVSVKSNFDQRYRLTAYHCFARVCLVCLSICHNYVVGLPLAHELF